MKQSLEEFCAEVNRLGREECERRNARPNKLFAAVHIEFPQDMLRFYYGRHTPTEALKSIYSDEQ